MGIFDWKHWLVILLVALVLFGSKRLKSLGGDLGEAISGFRRSVREDAESPPLALGNPADTQAESK